MLGGRNTNRTLLAVALLPVLAFASEATQPPTPSPASPLAPDNDVLQEVIVTAPEPRYVSPTRRDRIGRIWAPVYINDKGPFRLVLDTGASDSGIIAAVAEKLQIPENKWGKVTLRGVTGSSIVPTVRVDSLVVGDLLLNSKRLPIVTDALGGAEGILGTDGLADKRIYIDFRSDLIMITRSRNERAAPGYITIPVNFSKGKLLMVDARMGSVKIKAIIDTGGQVSIANLAARDALYRRPPRKPPSIDTIVGATADEQEGEGYNPPVIVIGDIQIRSPHMTFGDMHIFEHWKMTDEPAVLIGMDVLGLLDTLIIDYKRGELQIRMRNSG
jgi:Aspartyl protease